MEVRVHPRVPQRHPEISDEDATAAFMGTLRAAPRLHTDPVQWVGAGIDTSGRLLEYVAIEEARDAWLIFHAMSATTETLKELGLRQ